nr:hypothetical protein [Bosea robiniae]
MKNDKPSVVGTTFPGIRSNSCNPAAFSSCAIERLTFGCDVWRIRAAAVVDPVIMTARKASM